MYKRIVGFSALFALGLGINTDVLAAKGADDLERRVLEVMTSASARERAATAGKWVSSLCANCHGDKGVSIQEYIPNLAGQNAAYLLNQIEKFADGRRQDDFMSGLIKAIPANERLDMAVYYATLPNPPARRQPADLVAQGKKVYERSCLGCHGAKGHADRNIPRLAGQHDNYLRQALNNYRGAGATRKDPAMLSVTKALSEAEIKAVAAYTASLP